MKNGGTLIPIKLIRKLSIVFSVQASERLSQLMVIIIGNTALTNVISMFVLKAVVRMSEPEFQREKLYRIAISIAKSMLKNAVISEDEYRHIDTILLEKYKPTLGTLQKQMAVRHPGKNRRSCVNAFSSKIRCGECGSWYGSKVGHSTSKYWCQIP